MDSVTPQDSRAASRPVGGARLDGAAFFADTPGVNPGERYDVIVDVDQPGEWAFQCHILRRVEGTEGMFGMVSTLIVTPTKVDLTPLLT